MKDEKVCAKKKKYKSVIAFEYLINNLLNNGFVHRACSKAAVLKLGFLK